MTEAAIIVVAVVGGLVLMAVVLLGRSIKIDTNLLKAEIGRNGGNSAMDQLHKRFDELRSDLKDGLRQIQSLDARVAILETSSSNDGRDGLDGRDGRDGRSRRPKRSEPAA